MATPVFCCGFECGVNNATAGSHITSASAGGVSIVTTPVRSGSRALALNPSASLAWARESLGGNPPALGALVVRVYVRFATLPSTTILIAGTSTGFGVYFKQSDSKLYAGTSTAALGASGFTVTTGQWYRIDLRVDWGDGVNVKVDAQIDGSVLGQASLANQSPTGIFQMGDSNVNVTMSAFFDDVMVSLTGGDYPLGAGYVNHFVPTADGTHNVIGSNDFERSLTGTDITNATTDAYALIDDIPLESGTPTDFINLIAPPNATDYVECIFGAAPGINTPTAPPRCANIISAIAAFGTGTNNLTLSIQSFDQVVQIFSGTVGSTTVIYKTTNWGGDPPGGATAWNITPGARGNFNELRIRCSTSDANPDPYFVGTMIEAEFEEAGSVQKDTNPGALSLVGIAPTRVYDQKKNTAVGALVLSGIAGTKSQGKTYSIGVGALILTGIAPTRAVTQHVRVNTNAGALVLSGIAPTKLINTIRSTQAGAVTLSGVSPTRVVNTRLNTGIGALTLTGIAATKAVDTPKATQPGALALGGIAPTRLINTQKNTGVGAAILSGIAPAKVVSRLLNSDAGALVFTGIAPTVTVTLHVRVNTNVGALTLSGLTTALLFNTIKNTQAGAALLTGETATRVVNVTLQTQAGALVADGVAPNIQVTAGIQKNTQPGALVMSGVASTLDFKWNTNVGDLIIAGQQPTLSTPSSLGTNVGVMTLTGIAPTLSIKLFTGAGSLVMSGVAPSVRRNENKLSQAGQLLLTGLTPAVNTRINTNVGALLLTGIAPTRVATDHKRVDTFLGVLTLTGVIPTVFAGNAVAVNTFPGELIIAGIAPEPNKTSHVFLSTARGELLLSGERPTVNASNHVFLVSGHGVLVLVGIVPSAVATAHKTLLTTHGQLILTGLTPVLRIPGLQRKTYDCCIPDVIEFFDEATLEIPYTAGHRNAYGNLPTVTVYQLNGNIYLAAPSAEIKFDGYPTSKIFVNNGGVKTGFVKIEK